MILTLIVEDNNDKADQVISILCDCNIDAPQITRVGSISEAIKLMEVIQYDIIVLDMNLPIRRNGRAKTDSGVKILDEIENGNILCPLSIIGVTAYCELRSEYSDRFTNFDFNLYDSSKSDDWGKALKGKVEWLKRSKKSHHRVAGKKVIVTVHGISTAGQWQIDLEESIPKTDPNIICEKFEYYHISALKLLSNKQKDKLYKSFSSEIDVLFKSYPDSEFYFFGHSFGTYLLGYKLLSMKFQNSPKIMAVILAGSVLKRDFPWCQLKQELNIELIINDCGIKDKALLFSEIFVPKLGMAGRTGFYTFKAGSVVNRFHDGGHSFFAESKTFYSEYWLPVLDGLKVIDSPKLNKNIFDELLENFCNNIKFYFWLFFSLICFISILFTFFI
jgi:CheY-like chemotaxis protein